MDKKELWKPIVSESNSSEWQSELYSVHDYNLPGDTQTQLVFGDLFIYGIIIHSISAPEYSVCLFQNSIMVIKVKNGFYNHISEQFIIGPYELLE